MEMTKPISTTPVVSSVFAIAAIFALSFAIAPLALAASSGSDYPMEIIRAHTVYQVADPAALVLVGLGVQGQR